MSESYSENVLNIVNNSMNNIHSDMNGSWYKNAINKYRTQYLNKIISISPQFHYDIYHEEIDLDNRVITPCVEQHISLLYCYSGNFNNNDYCKLPIEYRRHVYKMLENQSISCTVSNSSRIADMLVETYKMPVSVSYVISWFWCSGKEIRSIILDDYKK